MRNGETPEETIARLEGRVETLEGLLAGRSRLLRLLTRDLCGVDLVTLSRLSCGLPALAPSGIGLASWRETTRLTTADVDRTMRDLWRSVTPPSLTEPE
ncbi:MAG: hypothetical protein ABR576_14710 [Thermoanaerobaculia bacterium]